MPVPCSMNQHDGGDRVIPHQQQQPHVAIPSNSHSGGDRPPHMMAPLIKKVHFPATPLELVRTIHVPSFVDWLASHDALESYYTSSFEEGTMKRINKLECKLEKKFGRDLYARESEIIRSVVSGEVQVVLAEDVKFYQVFLPIIKQRREYEKKKKVRRAARKLQKQPSAKTTTSGSTLAPRPDSCTVAPSIPGTDFAIKAGTCCPISSGLGQSLHFTVPSSSKPERQSLHFTVPSSTKPESPEPVVPTANPSATNSKDSTATMFNKGRRWSKEEQEKFLNALKLHGVDVNMIATKVKTLKMYKVKWKTIAEKIETRTTTQTKSHGQSYFNTLAKTKENQEEK